jgi:altronate hydrolase
MRAKKPRALQIHVNDNVAVALSAISQGQTVEVTGPTGDVFTMTAGNDIPFGFKIALTDLAPGETVVKYGEPIGEATQPIRRGVLVHVDNIRGKRA